MPAAFRYWDEGHVQVLLLLIYAAVVSMHVQVDYGFATVLSRPEDAIAEQGAHT
jgi:hypothetical protein